MLIYQLSSIIVLVWIKEKSSCGQCSLIWSFYNGVDKTRTADDGRRTADDGWRTTDGGRRTADDGRRTADDGQCMSAVLTNKFPINVPPDRGRRT